jgi:hypothetical protein
MQLLDALIATIFTRVTVNSSSPDQKVNSEVLETRWNTRAGVPMTSQGLGSCFMGVQNLCGERLSYSSVLCVLTLTALHIVCQQPNEDITSFPGIVYSALLQRDRLTG